ncbi:MAG: hypothetical protein M1830_003966 [Pleopsidium flavum]|nr:MAG: hypothetical protein M1830_003966 [Pleopsidium flavum]
MERKSSPVKAFQYNTSLPGRCFRLLTLNLGHGDEDICCTLKQTTLDSEIEFEAISYTWGDTTPTRRLWCNGKISAITRSLYSVLWQLREEGQQFSLWADAICINQSDTAEKTHQVRMMQEIYAKAKNVIIWLGKEEETDRQGIELMKQMYDCLGVPDVSLGRDYINAEPEAFGLPPIIHVAWSAVFNILLRSWFERVWVIQEILSAQSYTARCGALVLQPELLQAATLNFEKYSGFRPAILLAIQDLRDFKNASVICGLKAVSNLGGKLNLRDLLYITGIFKSTDPRDRVFAMIGISADGDSNIIDYGASHRDVLLQVAKQEWRSLASSNNAPSGLGNLTFIRDTPRAENLPSWVPDLGIRNFNPLHFYFAPVRSENDANFEKVDLLDEVLTIRGQLIDSAQVVVTDRPYEELPKQKTMPQNFDEFINNKDWQCISKSILDWESKCYCLAQSRENSTVEASAEEFWRTLVFNLTAHKEIASTEMHQSYEAWKEGTKLLVSLSVDKPSTSSEPGVWSPPGMRNTPDSFGPVHTSMTLPPDPNSGKVEMLWERISRMCTAGGDFESCFLNCAFNRCFFITPAGYMGWAPKDAQQGDQVCLFSGSDIPYLIRPRNSQAFQLIGACYIHGLMNGKARELGLNKKEQSISLI